MKLSLLSLVALPWLALADVVDLPFTKSYTWQFNGFGTVTAGTNSLLVMLCSTHPQWYAVDEHNVAQSLEYDKPSSQWMWAPFSTCRNNGFRCFDYVKNLQTIDGLHCVYTFPGTQDVAVDLAGIARAMDRGRARGYTFVVGSPPP
ncbi:uncharacterized protein PFL1_03828 [Pseudozyma flocculosa PF-1]|uniref:Uncharacterized protein n=2 Tax=Pseudozyma flocculosa TaxID=84751 RepID=A0A5C3EYH2_9BASI|nr:uncharacterized protein PFL1_03828 [Pseudozyma flocculosa PF-1]EPQ28525.1 hypothetical protein PFL1_03828 [Pseudozyma flocculosa PF-1]SPO36447.1 uncharacterized protein PSFLO_01918 [Pseudozyma flocculosa]